MRRLRGFALAFIGTTVLAMGAYWLFSLNHFFVQIHGDSMVPTFQDGDTVVLKKTERPSLDGIVIFAMPKAWDKVWLGEPNPTFIKRISMVGGDELRWDGTAWYRNGRELTRITSGSCPIPPTTVTVPQDSIFVTGDTTVGRTLDSREAFCEGLPYFVKLSDVKELGAPRWVF